MRLTDLTVEVRDLTLTRLGQVPPHALDFSATVVDSAPGEWHIRLPADHEMADPLRTPGAGIIVTGPDGVIFSGPMTRAEVESTWEDQTGVLVADGVTDEIILWDTLAYPTPDFDWSGLFMPDAYWSDTGLAWEVMGQLVLDQIIDSGRFDGLLGGLLDLDLSAVDGSGGGPGLNLIPNPLPTAVEEPDGGVADAAGTGWSNGLSTTYLWEATGPDGGWACEVYSATASPAYVWHTDAGTSAPAVTPGLSYLVSSESLHIDDRGEWSCGVEWYDAVGDLISTTYTDPAAPVQNGNASWPDVEGWYMGSPSGVLVAPEGAAHGRPLTRWDDLPSGGGWGYVALAYMGVSS